MNTINQFLLLSIALVIPLALHAWGANVHKKVYLANIIPLLGASVEARGSNKLRKIFLLISRCLFLLAIALVFVSTDTKNGDFLPRPQLGSYKAIIENSASMCFANDNQGLLEAEALVRRLNNPILRTEKYAASKFVDGKTYCGNDPKKLSEYTTKANLGSALCLFSDFQKSFVDIDKLPFPSKGLRLIEIKKDINAANVSIDSVWLSGNFIRNNIATVVYIQLRNNGAMESKNILVELKVGGKSVASNLETLAAYSVKKIQFSIVLQKEEDRFCEVKIDDGSWTFDNQFYFVLSPVDKLSVALLNENASINPIKIAFNQESVFNCKSGLKLGADVIQKAPLVVMNQIGDVSESDFRSLVELVKGGVTAVIIPSDKWGKKSTDLFNHVFGEVLVENISTGAIGIEVPDLRNPFFQNIFEQALSPTNMPVVTPIWKIRNASETILKTKNGEAALASFEIGKGGIYLFSFGIGQQDETFSRNAIFLPIFYRIAEKSEKNRVKSFFRVTDEIVEFIPKESSNRRDEVYSLENETFKIIPEQRLEGDKVRLFLPKQEMPLGIWHVKDKEGVDIVQFGLNSDKEESVVDFYSVEELRDKFKNDPKVEVMTLDEFKKEAKLLDANEDQWPIWRYAIVISFLFLLAEIMIARYYKNTFYRSATINK